MIFIADHGESLGEHGVWGHGTNAMEPSLHIPLVACWPGVVPQIISERMTIREAVLVVREAMKKRPYLPEEKPTYHESGMHIAELVGTRKTLLPNGDNPAVMYDLSEDPKEENPLPATASAELRKYREEVRGRAKPNPPPDVLEVLKSLGYVE